MFSVIWALIKLPFVLIKRVWDRWGFRGILVLGVVVVALILVVVNATPKTKAQIEKKAGIPPVYDAQYIVQTSSRYYYTNSYITEGKNTVLTNFWSFEGEKWVHYTNRLVLTPNFGKVEVKKRSLN